MAYKIDFSVATSDQIEAALCKRLESIRLSRNTTQTQLAEEAGVSPRTIGRLEKGEGVSMDTFIRVMTALGIQNSLEAILAWNPETNEFRSGQVDARAGFEHWLMKFDGITSTRDTEVATPKGYGKIEYAYYLMAVEAGIEMTTCRLHHEGGRSHFMTKRFDRSANGGKRHMQSLGAIAHYDYRQPASYSYEQAVQVIRRLGLPPKKRICNDAPLGSLLAKLSNPP